MITIISNDQISLTKKNIFISIINEQIFKNTYDFCIGVNINGLNADILSDLKDNASIDLIKKHSAKTINLLRHSCAHLLAHALKLIYPNIKLSVGPVINNGFYYDFFLDKKISFSDLSMIEKKMIYISKKNFVIKKTDITKIKAKKLFGDNKYKIEIINKIIENDKISVYEQSDFVDLCRGPHIPSTKFLKYFKLTKISGAYWKNNKENEMLYRIYGTAWENKKKLCKYIYDINSLKECDHRLLGKQLQLFDFHSHSPGVVFWNKNGWNIFLFIKNFIRNLLRKINYIEINTPIMAGDILFKKSGHIEKFIENMFVYKNDTNLTVLKPMSCPCHVNIFNTFYKKSYKNLPFRLSEFGSCFRNELSGALHGLMRLKNFTQDDGHIFCADYQLQNEIIKFIHILKKVYYKFDFKIFKIVLSKKPTNISTNLFIWQKAERILEDAIKCLKLNYSISNDGAFYGPKIEFSLRDKFNRLWQCGTIQVDFFTSSNLNAKYIDCNGINSIPIMLHRAILGSIERFIGVLLEHNSGYLPFWINPIQFKIIYINTKYLFYAKNIYNIIKNKYNVTIYFGNERLEYKIKQCILQKIPYMIIIGEKEYKSKTLTIKSIKYNKIVNIKLRHFLTSFSVIE